MRALHLVWPWPEELQVLPNEVKASVERALSGNQARYTNDQQVIMSFPGTAVHPIASLVFGEVMSEHPNNIGLHTTGASEKGFQGTQASEEFAVNWMAELLGDPTADGYLSSGGTEANIMGLWMGRNKLLREFGDPLDRRICVFASFLTHYSIRKSCDILGLGEGHYRPCPECRVLAHFFQPEPNGAGLVLVTTDRYGAISRRTGASVQPSSLESLRQQIAKKIGQGFKRFILVGNAGTTLTGAVDDIAAIGEMISNLQKKHSNVGFYFHVDAAFGGFVCPFLERPLPSGFAHPRVDSVTIDPHKMGLVAYPCGGILMRRGLANYVRREVGYVGGHVDLTVSGSRSGAIAVAVAELFRHLGVDGYRQIVRNCLKVTKVLKEALQKIPGVEVCPSQLNILPVAFTKGGDNLTTSGIDRLEEKYTLMGEWLPRDLSDLASHPRKIYKIVVMPHYWVRHRPLEVIQQFVADIQDVMSSG